ncbi:hypothetical protein BDV96DRAFT_604353 [Lophiotrema nucula]|uniref:JmjC domain-containing protein n=1 Tax=Lophiotrema nucula TaxID=690887 RepID=A0A6A5YRW8_9PLEO|nr:hypothetical protein BDV96DRAFT_604353 [Lophiotrema nucula]
MAQNGYHSNKLAATTPDTQDIINTLPIDSIWVDVKMILEEGSIRPIDPSTTPPEDLQELFGPHEWDQPHLVEGDTDLDGREIAELVFTDLLTTSVSRQAVSFSLHPKSGDTSTDSRIAARLLTNAISPLTNTSSNSHDDSAIDIDTSSSTDINSPPPGPKELSTEGKALWSIISPSVSSAYKKPPKVPTEEHPDYLWEAVVNTNIIPANGMADLHHDAGCVFNTLIEGQKLWIVYPPSSHNHTVLRSIYTQNYDPKHTVIFREFKKFENGIVFLQHKGETIWLPPYCPHAVFTIHDSVLTGGQWHGKRKFPQRLRYAILDLELNRDSTYLNYWADELDKLIHSLEQVLATPNPALHKEFLVAWDTILANGDFDALLLGEQVKKKTKGKGGGKNDRKEQFKKAWIAGTKDWFQCPVCDVRWEKGSKRKWFQSHFEEKHWLKEKGSKSRRDEA